jgi:uncharacterized protein
MDVSKFEEYIKNNDLASLEIEIKRDPEQLYYLLPNGVSLLTYAAYYRNQHALEIIRSYLSNIDPFEAAAIGELNTIEQNIKENPSSINDFASDGFTMLGLACYLGHLDIVKFLINSGADVNLPAKNAYKVAPIHSAVAIQNLDLVHILLNAGADVNVKQMTDVTPLHSAAYHGNKELVRLLIRHGADASAITTDGKTPTDYAREKGFDGVLD